MAVLLKRRHLETSQRTFSSRRPNPDSDLFKPDHSLTPKRVAAVALSRPTRTLPFPLLKRPSKPRIRSKERTVVIYQSEEDRLNHSFSCSQVSRSKSRRGMEGDGSNGDNLESNSGMKTASSQRKLGKSPAKERILRGEFNHSKEIFEELIRIEGNKNRSLLRSIKSSYEDYISYLESDLSELHNELYTSKLLNSTLQTTVKRLESLTNSLQTKIQTLKFEMDFRIFEAGEKAEETPADLSVTREEEVQILRKKIHFCGKLLKFMREKGLPVQETYREMKGKTEEIGNNSGLMSLSDLEIPLILPDFQEKRPIDIPKIAIPPIEARKPDFQDEFLSKYDEFSESWRLQCAKTPGK